MQQFRINANGAKTAHHVQPENILLTWFQEVTAAGVNVNDKVLHEDCEDIALSLGVSDLQASGDWVHRFKARHGRVYKSGWKRERSALGRDE